MRRYKHGCVKSLTNYDRKRLFVIRDIIKIALGYSDQKAYKAAWVLFKPLSNYVNL